MTATVMWYPARCQRAAWAIAYQPKADLRTGAIVGAEALVRRHHPRPGPLLPDVFLRSPSRSA